MASKRTRQRSERRDRRKAKASGWRREGRRKTGIVGHGGSGQGTFGYLGAVVPMIPDRDLGSMTNEELIGRMYYRRKARSRRAAQKELRRRLIKSVRENK